MAKTAFETVIETLTLDSWHKMDGMFGLNTVQHRTWSFLHLLMDICFLLYLYSNKMSDQFHHWCNWSVTFSNVLVTGLMLTCPGYSSPISFQHKLCKRSQHILPVKTEITCRTLALSQFALSPPPPPPQHKLCKRSQHILPVKTEITCRTLALSQFALSPPLPPQQQQKMPSAPPPPPPHTHTTKKQEEKKKRKNTLKNKKETAHETETLNLSTHKLGKKLLWSILTSTPFHIFSAKIIDSIDTLTTDCKNLNLGWYCSIPGPTNSIQTYITIPSLAETNLDTSKDTGIQLCF